MHLLMLSIMLWSAFGTFGPASGFPAAAPPPGGPANRDNISISRGLEIKDLLSLKDRTDFRKSDVRSVRAF